MARALLNLTFLRKTDVSLGILEARVLEMSVNISLSVVPNLPWGVHFVYDHYHVMPCSCGLHGMLWVAGGSMCERMVVTASAVTALASARQMSLA